MCCLQYNLLESNKCKEINNQIAPHNYAVCNLLSFITLTIIIMQYE